MYETKVRNVFERLCVLKSTEISEIHEMVQFIVQTYIFTPY